MQTILRRALAGGSRFGEDTFCANQNQQNAVMLYHCKQLVKIVS